MMMTYSLRSIPTVAYNHTAQRAQPREYGPAGTPADATTRFLNYKIRPAAPRQASTFTLHKSFRSAPALGI